MLITSYGIDFESATLSEASIKALLSRGLNHVLGNEVASKITSWKAAFEKEAGEAPTDEAVSAKVAEVRQAMVEKIVAGLLGVRMSGGTSVDPVEAEMERLAKAEINTTLTASKVKWTKGAEKGDPRTVTLGAATYTMDDLVERRIAQHGERLKKEAERNLKSKAKALAAAASVDVSAELGL